MLIFARHALAASLLDSPSCDGSPGPCGRLSDDGSPGPRGRLSCDSNSRAQFPGLSADEPALLLEGSWPEDESRPDRWSLDDAIDARFAWIDSWAADQAERLGRPNADFEDDGYPTLAYLNELALRYFLVKLLRVVVFFDELLLPAPGEIWQLWLADETDAAYADLFGALADRHGVQLAVHWQDSPGHVRQPFGGSTSRAQDPRLPCEEPGLSHISEPCLTDRRPNLAVHTAKFAERNTRFPWRRWAGCVANFLARKSLWSGKDHRQVFLCGNPRVLDPVCAELLARGCHVWWLYEEFAVRAWWKWHRTGVSQLLCDDARTVVMQESRLPRRTSTIPLAPHQAERRSVRSRHSSSAIEAICRGVRLEAAIGCWLSDQASTQGSRQAWWLKRLSEHFDQIQPAVLVVDEDATPFKRAAVAIARAHGSRSLVIQHGAPCGPFGFAPLAADEICVWGESTRAQLLQWGVDDARIHETGWPSAVSLHGAARRSAAVGRSPLRSAVAERRRRRSRQNQNVPPRFLLLATVPPNDARPDAATFHLTSRSHAAMIEMACAAVSRYAGARLIVKLHPRTPNAGVFQSLTSRWSQLDIRLLHHRDGATRFAHADCVLSCASTAGIEAALAGAPVVQLLPEGSGDILPADRWGMIGSARTLQELSLLIDQGLARGWTAAPARRPDIVAATGPQAAAAIAERVMLGGLLPAVTTEIRPCPPTEWPTATNIM